MKRNKTKHRYLSWPLLRCCSPTLRKDRRGLRSVLTENSPVKIMSVTLSQNARFGFLSVLCTARVLQPSVCCIRRTVFADTSMLNLTKSIRVNTRAESSSFACIFSSMALKALGKLVYFFLPSGNHTLPVASYRFGKRLTINWPWSNNTIFPYFSSNWTHIFTTKI